MLGLLGGEDGANKTRGSMFCDAAGLLLVHPESVSNGVIERDEVEGVDCAEQSAAVAAERIACCGEWNIPSACYVLFRTRADGSGAGFKPAGEGVKGGGEQIFLVSHCRAIAVVRHMFPG